MERVRILVREIVYWRQVMQSSIDMIYKVMFALTTDTKDQLVIDEMFSVLRNDYYNLQQEINKLEREALELHREAEKIEKRRGNMYDIVGGICSHLVCNGGIAKIPAIKELRQNTGWGLKEAKDAVEEWMDKLGLHSLS
jgi:hypothetical protein